jgi:hypothetical protein
MARTAQQTKRDRGGVLEILNARHMAQQSRLDHVMLWRMMRDLGFDVSENEVLWLCQDLRDREYILYDGSRDGATGRVSISKMQITAAGRDLCEGTTSDPAVHF